LHENGREFIPSCLRSVNNISHQSTGNIGKHTNPDLNKTDMKSQMSTQADTTRDTNRTGSEIPSSVIVKGIKLKKKKNKSQKGKNKLSANEKQYQEML
jgi:hypothetical protein